MLNLKVYTSVEALQSEITIEMRDRLSRICDTRYVTSLEYMPSVYDFTLFVVSKDVDSEVYDNYLRLLNAGFCKRTSILNLGGSDETEAMLGKIMVDYPNVRVYKSFDLLSENLYNIKKMYEQYIELCETESRVRFDSIDTIARFYEQTHIDFGKFHSNKNLRRGNKSSVYSINYLYNNMLRSGNARVESEPCEPCGISYPHNYLGKSSNIVKPEHRYLKLGYSIVPFQPDYTSNELYEYVKREVVRNRAIVTQEGIVIMSSEAYTNLKCHLEFRGYECKDVLSVIGYSHVGGNNYGYVNFDKATRYDKNNVY